MKGLLKLLDKLRPQFSEGGRHRKLKPLFDAIDAFHFAPLHPTRTSPHVRDPLDVKRYMVMVIVALVPCLLASVYFFGLRVLAVIAVSYAAGGLVEVAFAVIRKEEINEGFLVTGMLFGLILPPALPLWLVALGVMFGVLFGKELFGGTGRNLFNPALVGRVFLAMAYPVAMSASWIAPVARWPGRLTDWAGATDAVTSATPLAAARSGQLAGLPELFWGNVTGSIGETSAAAIILGGLFLVLIGVANWRTVAGTLGAFLVLQAVLHAADPARFAPPLWGLLAGGLLFGAFFMATDPVTSPVTDGAKVVYGILIGVVTVLIRGLAGLTEGVMFAILLGNIFAPLLDEVFIRIRLRRLSLEG